MNHTMTFLGVNDIFANGIDQFHTNVWIENEDKKAILIDCGTDAKVSIAKAGKKVEDLEAVYISHLHGDHCSLEWLGYYSFFKLGRKLRLFIDIDLVDKLWRMLSPSMSNVSGHFMVLHDYFDVVPIRSFDYPYFDWDDIDFVVIPVPHIKSRWGERNWIYSYGLSFGDEYSSSMFWLTTDTCVANYAKQKHWCDYSANQEGLFKDYSWNYHEYRTIFHDCCFNMAAVKTEDLVHSTYNSLANFPDEIKSKIWLVHHPTITKNMYDMAEEDGFRGFLRRGKTFKF